MPSLSRIASSRWSTWSTTSIASRMPTARSKAASSSARWRSTCSRRERLEDSFGRADHLAVGLDQAADEGERRSLAYELGLAGDQAADHGAAGELVLELHGDIALPGQSIGAAHAERDVGESHQRPAVDHGAVVVDHALM